MAFFFTSRYVFALQRNLSFQLISTRFQKDNAGVIVNPKGEMKGSAITGPVAKECVRSLSSHTWSHPTPDQPSFS